MTNGDLPWFNNQPCIWLKEKLVIELPGQIGI